MSFPIQLGLLPKTDPASVFDKPLSCPELTAFTVNKRLTFNTSPGDSLPFYVLYRQILCQLSSSIFGRMAPGFTSQGRY